MASVEQIKNKREGSRKRYTSNLYWFTLLQGLCLVFFAPQAKKVSLNQSIVQLQLITQ